MKIPLTKPYFDAEEEKAVVDVLRSGWVMQGPKVEEFEQRVSKYLKVKYAVAVSSGTAALHLSLLALGIANEDEVIVPSFSFISSANCILYVGANPVFSDIDLNTFNIDPKAAEGKITKKTKAIIAVHQVGFPAELDKLISLCKASNLYLVEDAACALGAEYKGKKIGRFGDIACFSFHPRKSITTGEGGIITTNKKAIYNTLRMLRAHGCIKKKNKKLYKILGYNYRMSDLQAAIGIRQLAKLDFILEKRRKLAERYSRAFSDIAYIQQPAVPEYIKHTYQSYMIRINHPKIRRDQIVKQLASVGIATRPGIMTIHNQPFYKKKYKKTVLQNTKKAARETLILPLYPQMRKKQQDFVISALLALLE